MEPKEVPRIALSAIQRTRKASDRNSPELKPKKRIFDCGGQEKMDVPTKGQREIEGKRESALLLLFYQGPQWLEWSPLTLVRVHLLTQPIDSNAYFVQKMLSEKHQKYFHQLSGNFLGLVKLACKTNYHTRSFFQSRETLEESADQIFMVFISNFSLNERGEKATHLSGFQISTFLYSQQT